MALIQAVKIIETVLEWIEEQRPVYDTLIDQYYTGRRLNTFKGRRQAIPASSIPSIEVSSTTDTIDWFACRVQGVKPVLQVDITIDNRDPAAAIDLQSALCTLTTRILATPIHLLPHIKGTQTHLFDALPTSVQYDQSAQNGAQRVAILTYETKYIEYLANRLFLPYLQIPPPLIGQPQY